MRAEVRDVQTFHGAEKEAYDEDRSFPPFILDAKTATSCRR